ncbi:hypothetical protein WDZ17_13785 [Pseudokineococcus basanitobsidens]|uniref:Uncharacterized protein n=1 Tax=Pseudokineococcus basanitobsidens TaxID=1926649 RepID=A0ABU8RMT4_9ACTN
MSGHGPSSGAASTAHLSGSFVLLVIAAAVSSCGVSTPEPREDGLAVAYYEPTGNGGDDALLTDVVENVDGCLVVEGDDIAGEEPYVPVFATNDSTAHDITQGTTVDLGGGAPGVLDGDWAYPDACPAAGPYWVVAQPE